MAETHADNVEKRINSKEQAELKVTAEKGLEQAREKIEKAAERAREAHEDSPDTARHEALEQAKTAEKEQTQEHEVAPAERRSTVASKAERKQAYKSIMTDVQDQLPAGSRAFSKLIHNPVVEKTSEAVGNTVARPNAILAGSVSAFLVVLAVYLIARYYGYPLSGSESVLAFIAGWLLGILYDFFRVMITGKSQ